MEGVRRKFLRPLIRLAITDHQTQSNTKNKLKIGKALEDMKA